MTANLENAIKKASRIKCTVRYIGARQYLVINPQGRAYTVRFEMHDGLRYGCCNCKAAAAQMACYHLAKAAAVDTAIQNMRG